MIGHTNPRSFDQSGYGWTNIDQPTKGLRDSCIERASRIGVHSDGRKMKHTIVAGMIFSLFVCQAEAKGCLKGAAVGAVAGHYAHHHAILGAAAGCIIGRHMANEKAREEKAREEHDANAHGAPPAHQ
jgi:hypothetical protein